MRRSMLRVALALGMLCSPVRAQDKPKEEPSADDKAHAVRLLAEGDKALKRGDKLASKGARDDARAAYEAGLKSYNGAYAVFPSPKIYFPIGQAEQKLGRFKEALGHYEQVLREGGNLSAEVRGQIEAALVDVKQSLGALVLSIDPAGARVSLDGDLIGDAPLEAPIYVEPGRHALSIAAEGHVELEVQVELPAGKPLKRTVVLRPRKVARTDPTPPDDRTTVVDAKPPSKVGVFVMLGVTGAFAASATITGLVANAKHDIYTDEEWSLTERERARKSGKRLAIATDVLLGGAVVMGAVTTFYYYRRYKPARRAYEEQLAVGGAWVAPWASDAGAGLAVGGSF